MGDPRWSGLSGNQNPSPPIAVERWVQAEAAAEKIVRCVQPTAESEQRRNEVVDYVQRLIGDLCGCEIFPFGSLPLKTYLPDGDIDLTTVGGGSVNDTLVNDMKSVLERSHQNKAAKFIVKDVYVVPAEVKLVKCIIQNIVVDISFNQLGGLRTLKFLEEADKLIGKDHLLKRSILMIKAWCYYESRILGAHHGLISTYAMETLILHIFNLFHSELDGPLSVLYRFLDYFSCFDWQNYCVGLNGRVPISSLPDIVAEKPEGTDSCTLFSPEFLKKCSDMYSASSSGVDTWQTFQEKHLNIVDPLKENNNLGRSVSKGSFYRIRSAFIYGAKKLQEIMLQPEDNIAFELSSFFSNTLSRNIGEQRPDVQDPSSPDGELEFLDPIPLKEDKTDGLANRTADVGYRISGDAEDLATSTDELPKISDKTPKEPQRAVPYHAPHLYFSRPPVVGPKDNGAVSNPVPCPPSVPKDNVVEPLASLREDSERTTSTPPALSQSLSSSDYSKQNGFPKTNGNAAIPRPDTLHMKAVLPPHALFKAEQKPKPQGTGTFFSRESKSPSLNALTGNGRSPGSVARLKSSEEGKGAPQHSDPFKIAFPDVKVRLPEKSLPLDPALVRAPINTGDLPTTGPQKQKPMLGLKESGMKNFFYRLKNEDDFPPLSA